MNLDELQEQLKGLSPEEQQEKAKELMKELPEEELARLQQQQCPFCLIGEGKIEAETIFEDFDLKAILDIHPANQGHVIVFPKRHYTVLPQMAEHEISHLFKIANRLSNAVHDALKAEGTNIYVANGIAAGQKSPHVLIHVIPRFEGDQLNFNWNPKEMNKEEAAKIAVAIKQHIPKEKKEEIEEEEVEEVEFKEEERVP